MVVCTMVHVLIKLTATHVGVAQDFLGIAVKTNQTSVLSIHVLKESVMKIMININSCVNVKNHTGLVSTGIYIVLYQFQLNLLYYIWHRIVENQWCSIGITSLMKTMELSAVQLRLYLNKIIFIPSTASLCFVICIY